MKPIPFAALAAFAFSVLPAPAEKPTFEAWSYTGTDIFPSAVIATATVDWHAEEAEGAEEPEAEAADTEPKPEETPTYGDLNAWVGALRWDCGIGGRRTCGGRSLR